MSPVWALEKMNFRDPGLTDSNTTVIYEGKFQTIYLQCSRSWNVAEMPLNCLFESKVGSLISEVLQVFLASCWFKMMLVRIELKNGNFPISKRGVNGFRGENECCVRPSVQLPLFAESVESPREARETTKVMEVFLSEPLFSIFEEIIFATLNVLIISLRIS